MREKIPEKIPEKVPEKVASLGMRVGGTREKIPEKGSVREETPPINDHQAWRRYIMDDGVESSGESGQGNDPHLTLLLKLDQVGHHKLLKYLHRWSSEDGFCETIGLWIFSVLACLEKPIHSDVYATLRDISRTLSSERKETGLEPKDINSINIIICIIGRYFDQKDMVDEWYFYFISSLSLFVTSLTLCISSLLLLLLFISSLTP